MRAVLIAIALGSLLAASACNHTQTVRLQPNTIEVGKGLRPIAGIQSNAVSWYVLFVPIPGGVDLDKVVNRMLVVTAKAMGADKIANLRFDGTPSGGIWALRKLFWYRSASASGIAVQVIAPAADPDADDGPEPAGAAPADHGTGTSQPGKHPGGSPPGGTTPTPRPGQP